MQVPSETLPARRCSRLHTRSAKPRVSACNLGAASGLGTLERSKVSVEGGPERVRDARFSRRLRAMACCWQAVLGRELGAGARP